MRLRLSATRVFFCSALLLAIACGSRAGEQAWTRLRGDSTVRAAPERPVHSPAHSPTHGPGTTRRFPNTAIPAAIAPAAIAPAAIAPNATSSFESDDYRRYPHTYGDASHRNRTANLKVVSPSSTIRLAPFFRKAKRFGDRTSVSESSHRSTHPGRVYAQVDYEDDDLIGEDWTDSELSSLPTIPDDAWAPEPVAGVDPPLKLARPNDATEELPIPRGVASAKATETAIGNERNAIGRFRTQNTRSVGPNDAPFGAKSPSKPTSKLSASVPPDDDHPAITLPEETDDKTSREPDGALYKTGAETAKELLLQSARNAVRLDQPELAIQRFTKYVRQYPDDLEARMELAGALASAGRRDAASAQIEHLYRHFPNDDAFLRRYADMQLQISNFPRAESALLRLIRMPRYRIDAAVDLARVFAWTHRTEEAVEVYEEVLRNVALHEPQRQLQFAEMLVDIERPHEALELLLPLHERRPMDLHLIKLLLYANARSGNPQGTMDFVERLRGIEPENVDIRFEIASVFFEEGFYREAILIDQQVLDFDPGNTESLIRSALANLKLYEVSAARGMLSNIESGQVLSAHIQAKYLRAMAEYHSVVGEHADAIAVCRRLLTETPHDLESRQSLGHVYHRAGQFMRANSVFRDVAEKAGQPGVADGEKLLLKAQLARARVLCSARRFDEAIAVLDTAAALRRNKEAILDTYIDVLVKAKRYSEALETVRVGLADSLGKANRELQLRSKLGLILFRNGEYASALQELDAARSMSGHDRPTPEIVYGTYQSHKLLGNHETAENQLAASFGIFSSDTYLSMRVAELATDDCDCCLATKMLRRLEQYCATNPLVANRLGEACMQCAACEETCNCVQYFANALTTSPSNVQAMLGIARANARLGNFEEAQARYELARKHIPSDPNLVRELARMMKDWKGEKAATEYYDQALQLANGEHLFAAAEKSPERTAELEIEYASLAEMGAIISTEREGKMLAGWRPLSAIESFEGEATLEPHNQDAVFEIAQAYSQLNRTHCAIEQYERLLCQNPCHREAKIALARNRLELRPQLHLFGKYRTQAGRSELAEIDSVESGALLQFPLGDEDEFIQIGYKHAHYLPPSRRSARGDIALGRIQWKPVWPVLLYGNFDYETFDFGFQPRINFDTGIRYRFLEDAELRLRGIRENVVQNGVALANDIHRQGIEIGKIWRPTSRLELDFYFRHWSYSDDNNATEAGINSGYRLTHGRHRFRWLTDFDYTTYREGTVFPASGQLENAIHPYFAPRDFWYVSGGLEYRRYLRCDTYKGANLHWFELYGGGRLDSSGNGYALARGELQNDLANWVTLTGYFNVVHASVYRATEVGAQLTIRF